MTKNIADICSAVKKIAWGFLFIFININIASIDILPDWIGYIVIVAVLKNVIADEDDLRKLRPVGIVLIVWNIVEWILAIFNLGNISGCVAVIPMLFEMYLIYNLFKYLSVWADKYSCSQQKSLTLWGAAYVVFALVSTVCGYMSLIFSDVATFMIVGFVILAVGLIVMLGIMITLFSFSRTLKKKSELPMYQTMYQNPDDNIHMNTNG